MYLCSGHKSGQFPLPVYIPVPVEPAAKACPLEFFRKHIDILLGQPGRKNIRQRECIDKSFRLAEQKTPALVRRWITGKRVKALNYGLPDIFFQFLFDLAGFLKIELIKIVFFPRHLFHHFCWWCAVPGSGKIWNAEQDQSMEDVRPEYGAVPCNRCTPVMPYYYSFFFPQGMNCADDVCSELEDVVCFNRFRTIRPAVTSLVRSYCMESCIRQCFQLVPPGIPYLGPSVAHDDQRTLPHFSNVHFYTVGFDKTMLNVCHVSPFIMHGMFLM